MKAILSIALLSLVSLPAYAVQLEAGVGTTRYTIQGDGTWYQKAMPNKVDMDSMGYLLGLTGNVWRGEKGGLDWHADYVNLGHISSFCRCTTIDADYDMKNHRLFKTETPIADYSGHGTAHGFKLSLAPYVTLGKWDVGVEGGVFVHRSNWQMKVYGWSNVIGGAKVDGRHDTPQKWTSSKMLGVFVRHERLTVAYSYYRLPTRYRPEIDSPALWKAAYTITLSYAFGGTP